MSEPIINDKDPYYELYQKTSNRTIHYAGLIGYSIGTLKFILQITTDDQIKQECERVVKYIQEELSNLRT